MSTTLEIEVLSQMGDFLISARAELFLFSFAIAAHLVLFGNIFPSNAKGKKKMMADPVEEASAKPRTALNPNPQKLEECERCLQIAFDEGDYRAVLHYWNLIKKSEKVPSVNLAHVVEAMQRFKKDAGLILGEIRTFYEKHPSMLDITNLNDLLESVAKSLDTELAQSIVDCIVLLGLEPDCRMYDIMMHMHFSARSFAQVHAVRAKMEAKGIAPSLRAHLVLLKTALRTSNVAAALEHFRGARSLWAVTKVGESPERLFPQIVDLACKEHKLSALVPELKHTPLTAESLNTMLNECAQEKNFQLMETLEKLAREQGVTFTDKTYQLLIKNANGDHARISCLFNEIIDAGVEWGAEVAALVLESSAQERDLELADRLFKHMKPTQVPTLCALIRFYADAELHDKACDVYEWFLKHSNQPMRGQRTLLDARTECCLMNSLMKAGRESTAKNILDAAPANVAKHIAMIRDCADKKNLDGAMSVFRTLEKSGAELTQSMYNSVLDACVVCGDLACAELWMRKMRNLKVTDVISYNTLLKAQVRAENFDKARALMEEMRAAGMEPNNVTFNELINGMVKSSDIRKKEVWEVVNEMKACGIKPNRVTCSILLKDLKAKSSTLDITSTMDLINVMEEPMDEILLSSVVEACVRVGKPDLLTKTLAQVNDKKNAISVSGAHTFGSLIKAYGHAKDIDGAWRCWKEMRSRHIRPTSITIGCMVEAVACNGDIEGAYELIHQMHDDNQCRDQVNAVIFCSVLKGFAHAKKMDRVWAVWEDMLSRKIQPVLTTYNALLDACARNGCTERMPGLVSDMKKRGLTPNLITYSTVLKGYCLSGDISAAFSVIDEMRRETKFKPDEIMYNTLLDGCAQAHLMEEGLKLLEQMQTEGIRPSNFTLSILVKMASHARQLDRAFDLVQEITSKYRFKPNGPVYGNLVQACVANKDLKRGINVLAQMGKERVQPDTRTYSLLIRGCLATRDFNAATKLLRSLLALPSAGNFPSGAKEQGNGRGLDDIVNEVLNALLECGREPELAAALLTDLRQHRPQVRIDSKTQRRIMSDSILNL